MSSFPTKLFTVFLLLGLYLATSAPLPYGDRKSLSHVFDRVDELRITLAMKEGNSGYENMETFDHTVVPSRSLRLTYLSPPPSPAKNKLKSAWAAAPPPLVA